jgi:protein-disulfide isomerase
MTSSSASRKAKIQAAAPRGGGGGTNKVVVATVVVVLVLAAVVTAVILGSRDKQEATTAGGSSLPAGAAAMGAGVVINPGAPATAPTLDVYEDFQCPICGEFERIFGLQIVEMVKANQVKLVAHPLSFLDDNLRNDSSNRAANAAACAADAGKFLQYHTAVFHGQPAKEGTGYTDAQLKQFAQTAGITGTALTTWDKCYADKAHNQWVESVQTQSEKDKVNGTPTLRLDGKDVNLTGLTQATLAEQVKAASQ